MVPEEKKEGLSSLPPFRVTDKRSSLKEEGTEAETEGGPGYPTFVEQLLVKVDEKDRQLREYISAYKKMQSDMDDYRLRLNRDIERRVEEAMAGLFSEFLEILDNLERAMRTAGENQNVGSLIEGLELIRDQMSAKLSGRGVTPLDALGEDFDPRFHEAVEVIPVDEPDENDKVLKVVENGYVLGDRLIRPAKVGVGKLREGSQGADPNKI